MDTSQLRREEFWRSFAAGLRTDGSMLQKASPLALPPEAVPEFMRQLKEDGYFQQSADWGVDLKLMANTARAISQADLPPVFAFLYDEFWYPFFRLRSVYEGLLGGRYYILPGCWVWNVDPKKGDSGWAPHRDAGRAALFDDGSPKSVTTWIPLSAATPLNGCMYIVPPSQDPTYATADEVNWKGKFDYAGIRALPVNPGEFLIWNQAVLHWGGKSSPRATESRVSVSFEFQRADVPPIHVPLIEPTRVLTFEMRLQLVCKQILQYHHMYKLDPEIARLARELVGGPPAWAPSWASAGVSQSAAPAPARNPSDSSSWGKVSRNEPCPCGSGKRYKQCHGRLD